jgi:hypothetical protein
MNRFPVMNRFPALKMEVEPAPPGLRATVAMLRSGGFAPSAYYVDQDNTCIEIDCAPEQLIAESHRLHMYLANQGIPAYTRACDGDGTDDEPYVAIQAVYDPVDREATIELWGLRDALLR